MANALYDKGRQGFLRGEIVWQTDTIKTRLLPSTYTVNLSTHDFLDDLPTGIGTDQTLTTKTTSNGVADADDVVYTSLTGSAVSFIAIYKSTGTPSTSALIAYIDTATNLPYTPTGATYTIQWDSGANRIFKL